MDGIQIRMINKSADVACSVLLQQTRRSLRIVEELVNVLDLLLSDLAPALGVRQHPGWGQQLHAVTETGLGTDLAEVGQGFGGELDVFGGGSDGQDLHELFQAVVGGLDDEKSVQKIDGDTVGRDHISASDGADSSIGGQHYDGGESGLEGAIEEGEAFDIEHVDLIDEEHSGYQLCNTLVDVSIDHFVDLSSQFFSHLGLLWFHDLAHKAHEVVATLGTGVGHVQIVQSHILYNFLLLVNIALGKRDIFLSFEVELARVGIASTHSLDVAGGGFDVDDITDRAFLPGEVFVDGGIELELLGSFGGLEGDDDAGDDFIS